MNFQISKQLVVGWILTIVLIISTYWLETIPPKFTEFFEGDLALSYSVHDTVPYKYVIIYCHVVPTILLCLFVIICRPKDASVWVHDILYLSSRSYAVSEVFIIVLKNFVGRPRPCFFELCQYEKVQKVLSSGEVVQSFGIFGVVGNVTKCHGTEHDIYNAFRSFPSGHSATAANALVTLTLLYFRFVDSHFAWKQYSTRILKVAVILPLIVWCSFIFGSRIFDYRHRPEDVIGGIVFGTLASLLVSLVFYPCFTTTKRVTDTRTKGKNAHFLCSMFYDDVMESLINVYTPVSKPESVIV